jgi:hypothetical protein
MVLEFDYIYIYEVFASSFEMLISFVLCSFLISIIQQGFLCWDILTRRRPQC